MSYGFVLHSVRKIGSILALAWHHPVHSMSPVRTVLGPIRLEVRGGLWIPTQSLETRLAIRQT